MTSGAAALLAAAEATWPPARRIETPGFTLREGRGGGQRVSAATLSGDWDEAALDAAEAAMEDLGQPPLFQLRAGDEALDAALAARGYEVRDPTALWLAPVDRFTGTALPRVTVFDLWEPLAIQREMWAAAGIGPARLEVMARALGPKTALLGRVRDKPGGTGFCAVHGDTAFIHALEIVPGQRRQGLGRWMTIAAAHWAAKQGATRIAALCVRENASASALYAALGFGEAGGYHYRISPRRSAP